LGGSITAQAGWRPKTLAWFKKNFPSATFSEINAAIGGTGSDLGVFRLQHDVLDHKPDLLFVEFAVNDGGTEPSRIQQAMEGIVRQTWKANPKTDICFV
jgi:lysophospholipase L1-like esterase